MPGVKQILGEEYIMGEYVKVGNLQVASVLFEFINKDGLPGSELNQEQFWVDFEIGT